MFDKVSKEGILEKKFGEDYQAKIEKFIKDKEEQITKLTTDNDTLRKDLREKKRNEGVLNKDEIKNLQEVTKKNDESIKSLKKDS